MSNKTTAADFTLDGSLLFVFCFENTTCLNKLSVSLHFSLTRSLFLSLPLLVLSCYYPLKKIGCFYVVIVVALGKLKKKRKI